VRDYKCTISAGDSLHRVFKFFKQIATGNATHKAIWCLRYD